MPASARRLGTADCWPILPSVPASRRAMLARCMTHSSAVSSSEQRAPQPAGRRARAATGVGERWRSARPARSSASANAIASQTPPKASATGQARPSSTPMIGRDALAALEAEPDRKQVAEEGAEPGERSRAVGRTDSRRSAPRPCPSACRTSSVAAARPLRPVRSTLVAPILPEPICADVGDAGEAA